MEYNIAEIRIKIKIEIWVKEDKNEDQIGIWLRW